MSEGDSPCLLCRDHLHRVEGGGYGAVDVFGGVGGGDEGGLELRWREENAAVEHLAKEARVAFGIGALRSDVITHGLIGEEYRAERVAGVHLRRSEERRVGK